MELLAPAGSYKALIAAVQSGADAVYVGGSKFSARGSADNFDNEELIKWVKYCHLRGVSVHVAANTLIKEKETKQFLDYIGFLNEIGVDAVIMQDLGMAYAARKMFPDLPLHASTQLTCASLNTAISLKEIGFSRIVLARELNFEGIETIKKSVGCEIETFVHGAICMSYSGQCLMSSMIGGRSGNRGFCAQPCRLPYNLQNNGKDVVNGYLLSPKDMSLSEHLLKLKKIGVDSLKIEGRLKRAEYVSAVVGVYRKLIDEMRLPQKSEKQELLDAFNRSGFTDGYFTGNLGKSMMAYETPSNIADNKFTKEAEARCYENKEVKKIPVSIEAELKIGMPLVVTMSDGTNSVTLRSETVGEYAIKSPLGKERLVEQLKKLGATVFSADTVYAEIDDGITISVGEINSVRRKAVEKLSDLRIKTPQRREEKTEFKIENKNVEKLSLSAKVRTLEQAKICIECGIKRIYAPCEVKSQLRNSDAELITLMPPIESEAKNNYSINDKKIIASALGQLKNEIDFEYSFDYRMNITNSYTLELLKNCKTATLSPELSLNEIRELKKTCNTEIIVYGRLPLMTFENCPVKAAGKCDNGKSKNVLIDRKKEEFPLVCAQGCFCELLNSKPIYMADKIKDLKNLGVAFLRLDFTLESKEECQKIIQEYINAIGGISVEGRKENTFTRGHFYKPVI